MGENNGGGAKEYWRKVKAGEIAMPEGIGKRGKDKPTTMRKIPASKTIATRYYENTGRRIDQDMADQRMMVDMMFDAASAIHDPEDRFNALDKAQAAMTKFNQTWLPYTERKLGTLQSTTTVEEHQSLDDILNTPAIESKKDGD